MGLSHGRVALEWLNNKDLKVTPLLWQDPNILVFV